MVGLKLLLNSRLLLSYFIYKSKGVMPLLDLLYGIVHFLYLNNKQFRLGIQCIVEDLLHCLAVSGGTSTHKLELSVAGASNPSARVKKLFAWKFGANNIFLPTHASDAFVS